MNRKLSESKSEHGALQGKIARQRSEITRLMTPVHKPSTSALSTKNPPISSETNSTESRPRSPKKETQKTIDLETRTPKLIDLETPCSSSCRVVASQSMVPVSSAPSHIWLPFWNFNYHTAAEMSHDPPMCQAVADYFVWSIDDYFNRFGFDSRDQDSQFFRSIREDSSNFTSFCSHNRHINPSGPNPYRTDFHNAYEILIKRAQRFLSAKVQRFQLLSNSQPVPISEEIQFILTL